MSQAFIKDETVIAVQKHNFTVDTLYYAADEDIDRVNETNCLTDYISNNSDFLCIDNPNIGKICSQLELLKVKFNKINYDKANPSLFQAIYQKSLYAINVSNISLILNKVYEIPENTFLWNHNYSLVCSKPNEPLLKYLNNNIETYFDLMIKSCKSQISDNEDTVIEFLNNKNIDDERKLQYIAILHTHVLLKSIKVIENTKLWSEIFNRSIVLNSAENILEYFFNAGNGTLDTTLAKFIKQASNTPNFNYEQIDQSFGENKASTFFAAVVQCNTLDDQKYKKILKSFKRVYPKFLFTDISSKKIEILIEMNIIQMTSENLVFIRANYPDIVIGFILSDQIEYTNILTQEIFERNELENLLIMQEFDNENKIKILEQFIDDEVSIKDKHYSNAVRLHLLQNNFNDNDIDFLIDNFDKEVDVIQKEISKRCREKISNLIKIKTKFSLNLLLSLLLDTQIQEDHKYQLLINHLPNLKTDQAKKCFETMGKEYWASLFDGKKTRIEKNETTEQLLTILKEKKWISSYKQEEKDESNYFQVIGRK
jgi:hypothetical protein